MARSPFGSVYPHVDVEISPFFHSITTRRSTIEIGDQPRIERHIAAAEARGSAGSCRSISISEIISIPS